MYVSLFYCKNYNGLITGYICGYIYSHYSYLINNKKYNWFEYSDYSKQFEIKMGDMLKDEYKI